MMTATSMAATIDLDDPADIEAFFDGVVLSQMKSNGSPSGTVAITRNGKLIFAKGYGYQDIEQQIPVDPFTT